MRNALPRRALALLSTAALAATMVTGTTIARADVAGQGTSAARTASSPLTNLDHLDFLLDTATVAAVDGHTTFGIADEPRITMPWTYADARDGGTFARVGGGPFDAATGHWGQGAYNSDDITRAAVVYLRAWQQTGDAATRDTAYELLRSVAYFQTTEGENAGNVVLWMQPDGTFNRSPEPVELPNPSDSGESYWLARTIWALGEGYAAFAQDDPEFAAFLQQRLQLGVSALERESLSRYGQWAIADGEKVPAWLIVDGADASAEAVLGLSAYTRVAPDDVAARTALTQLAEGIAAMGSGDTRTWPYGAILPWAQSRSMWHAWASQMPAALARASAALGDPALLGPAVADSAQFTPALLTAGGPDNAWYPTPVEKVQIAYGADSRLQSLLAVADVAHKPGLRELAGMMGAWFFGSNKSGQPVYDPASGVTYDGVQADGTINRNSGAESTIHGLLAMIALDANPDVAARALAATSVPVTDGLTVVEGETATTGTVVTPESAWTGESQYGGGAYLELTRGRSATFPVAAGARSVEPVTFQAPRSTAVSLWKAGRLAIGVLRHSVGEQGITAVPGALLPNPLMLPVTSGEVTVRALSGTVQLDALIVRPLVGRATHTGSGGATELVQSTSLVRQKTTVGTAGTTATLRSYDRTGALLTERAITGVVPLTLQPGGFAVASR
ncbi:MAG: hypothetical protein H7146_14655 [Burkholderiaceae bacterium]|nr:hypothetical protein [Microbacteriaceae bacterium]